MGGAGLTLGRPPLRSRLSLLQTPNSGAASVTPTLSKKGLWDPPGLKNQREKCPSPENKRGK